MSDAEVVSLGCTRQKGSYTRIVVPLAAVVLVEASVLAIAAHFVFRSSPARAPAFAAVGMLVALASFVFVAPLRSRHGIVGNDLVVRFGAGPKSVRLSVPFGEIADIVPAQERLVATHPLGPYLDSRRRRLVVAFSDVGQVLVRLKEGRDVRFGLGRRARVDEVLLSVDDPERLLGSRAQKPARLSAPAIAAPPSAVAISPVGGAPIVQVEGLTRRFGDRTAVRELTLRLVPGEVYGLLGCNGAGKTSTIRMLVGLLEPCAGTIRVGGLDVWRHPVEARRATGYLPDVALLYERLTGREFLEFVAQVHGIPRRPASSRGVELLAAVDLANDADRPCGTYSLGMKRRLGFAGALVHRPRFLVLDEPLSGLDPRSARHLKDRIRDIARQGTAVLLSTHDLATAEELCGRIGVLHRGVLVAEGNASDLRARAAAPDLEAAFLALTPEEQCERNS